METKICTKCKKTKSISDIAKNKSKKDGLDVWCKQCHRENYHKKCELDPSWSSAQNNWKFENPEKYLYNMAKARARKDGVFFDITVNDIVIPEKCPILGMPLVFNTRYAPSIDRLIPELGYTRENINVISYRANTMKNDSSLEELKMIVKFVEEELKSKEELIRGYKYE